MHLGRGAVDAGKGEQFTRELRHEHACGVVWCGVVWCGVVWCGVPKALLPKGKGRDVYPRVQVNGLGCVCCVRAVCKCVVA